MLIKDCFFANALAKKKKSRMGLKYKSYDIIGETPNFEAGLVYAGVRFQNFRRRDTFGYLFKIFIVFRNKN